MGIEFIFSNQDIKPNIYKPVVCNEILKAQLRFQNVFTSLMSKLNMKAIVQNVSALLAIHDLSDHILYRSPIGIKHWDTQV